MENTKVIFKSSFCYLLLTFIITFGIMTIVASGGGGGGDDDGNQNSAPVISGLYYFPEGDIIVGSGGGEIELSIYVNFSDSNGNINKITLVDVDTKEEMVIDVDTEGETSGELGIGLILNTNEAEVGDFAFQIYATDTTALKSNTLEGIYNVTLGNAPVIANVVFSPNSAFVDETTHIEGSYDFTDFDGNALYTFISVFDSDDKLVTSTRCDPASSISGLTSGKIDFSFDLTLSVVGEYKITIVMFDENDLYSDAFYGSFWVTGPL